MKKIFAIALFMLTISMGASAFTNGDDWFTYPEYNDRAAWKELAGPSESEIIKTGEQYLKYQWKPVHASAYIEYAKTGNLELLAQEDKNREALDAMIAAELVEGKGRFILQIADIIWLETTRFSWSRPQYAEGQIPARSLPASGDKLISRSAVENAVSIAIAYHFFKDKIDSLDPSICRMVYKAMNRNIFEPYLAADAGFSSEQDILSPGILLAFHLMAKDNDIIKTATAKCSLSAAECIRNSREYGIFKFLP